MHNGPCAKSPNELIATKATFDPSGETEVDALLRGISGGEIETEEEPVESADGIVPFDLVNQDRIIRARMPVLEIINDRFSRLMAGALGNTMRKRIDVNPMSIEMSKFGDRRKSLLSYGNIPLCF